MNKSFGILAILSLGILSLSTAAVASETDTVPELRAIERDSAFKPHVGLQFGLVNPDGPKDSNLTFGAELGFQPIIPIGAVLELSYAGFSDAASNDFSRLKLLAKGTFNFGGDIPVIKHSYLGLGVGPMVERTPGDTDIALGIMPFVGADIPLSGEVDPGEFSLGANVRYLFSSTGAPDSFGVSSVLKYWY